MISNMETLNNDLLDILPVNFRFLRNIESTDSLERKFRLHDSCFYQSEFSTCRSPEKSISKIICYEKEDVSNL